MEILRGLGADEVINYVETPEWSTQVLELTNEIGVDLVIEVGGMGSIDYADMLPINYKLLTLFANGMGVVRIWQTCFAS